MLPKGAKIQGLHGHRYEILDHLSQDEQGEFYKAQMAHESRFVTIQFVSAKHAFTVEVLRFLRETQLGSLDHENIVAVIELDAYREHPMIVTEFTAGGSVQQRLGGKGVFAEGDALRIARDVAKALAHLEKHRVVHRDIKPANVMLTAEGKAKLTGFGVARVPGSVNAPLLPGQLIPADFSRSLTIGQGQPGTIPYVSPEQATGAELDTRSDMYSLGVSLFEMLIGARPFEPNGSLPPVRSRQELLGRIVKQAPPDPRKRRRDLSVSTARLLLKLLSKDPFHRYQTAGDLVAAIDGLLKAPGVGAVAEGLRQRPALEGVFEALADPTLTRRALIAGEIIGVPKGLRKP